MQLSKLNNNVSGAFKYGFEKEKDYLTENSKTVLIIDDEIILIKICAMMLKLLGHKVFKANSGSEGLNILRLIRTGLILSFVICICLIWMGRK